MRNATEAALDYLTGDGWANKSDGHVDSPTGWFALIDLTTDRDIMADILEDHDGELPDPGWYVYRINGDGIIMLDNYGDDEHAARRHYRELDDAYTTYLLAPVDSI